MIHNIGEDTKRKRSVTVAATNRFLIQVKNIPFRAEKILFTDNHRRRDGAGRTHRPDGIPPAGQTLHIEW